MIEKVKGSTRIGANGKKTVVKAHTRTVKGKGNTSVVRHPRTVKSVSDKLAEKAGSGDEFEAKMAKWAPMEHDGLPDAVRKNLHTLAAYDSISGGTGYVPKDDEMHPLAKKAQAALIKSGHLDKNGEFGKGAKHNLALKAYDNVPVTSPDYRSAMTEMRKPMPKGSAASVEAKRGTGTPKDLAGRAHSNLAEKAHANGNFQLYNAHKEAATAHANLTDYKSKRDAAPASRKGDFDAAISQTTDALKKHNDTVGRISGKLKNPYADKAAAPTNGGIPQMGKTMSKSILKHYGEKHAANTGMKYEGFKDGMQHFTTAKGGAMAMSQQTLILDPATHAKPGMSAAKVKKAEAEKGRASALGGMAKKGFVNRALAEQNGSGKTPAATNVRIASLQAAKKKPGARIDVINAQIKGERVKIKNDVAKTPVDKGFPDTPENRKGLAAMRKSKEASDKKYAAINDTTTKAKEYAKAKGLTYLGKGKGFKGDYTHAFRDKTTKAPVTVMNSKLGSAHKRVMKTAAQANTGYRAAPKPSKTPIAKSIAGSKPTVAGSQFAKTRAMKAASIVKSIMKPTANMKKNRKNEREDTRDFGRMTTLKQVAGAARGNVKLQTQTRGNNYFTKIDRTTPHVTEVMRRKVKGKTQPATFRVGY